MNERAKELAEQSGLVLDGEHWFSAIQQADVRNVDLEIFLELIRQDEREQQHKHYEKAIGIAIDTEREACAKLFDAEVWSYDYREIAATIRARSNHEQT